MKNLRKRNGIWQYRFCIESKVYRGSTRCTELEFAKQVLHRAKVKAYKDYANQAKEKHTFLEALEEWLIDKNGNKTVLESANKGRVWSKYFDLYKVKYLTDITPDIVRKIIREKLRKKISVKGTLLSPATINRYVALLRTVLNFACKDLQWIDHVPRFRLEAENNARSRYLTLQEYRRLYAVLPEPYNAMAQLSVATGLRQANVLGLLWEQVDLSKRMLTFPKQVMKNGQPFSMPLNQSAIDVIKDQLGKHQKYVFVRSDGTQIKQVPSKLWSKALKDSSLEDFRWHDLRHTWASWLRQHSNMSLDRIQELGGWKDSNMVKRYSHLSVEHVREISNEIDTILNQDNLRSHSVECQAGG